MAVTYECDEPAGVRDRVPVVVDSALPPGLDPAGVDAAVRDRLAAGLSLYVLDEAALRAAAPDIVLTQDLCRVCALPAGTVADALTHLGLDADVVGVDPRSVDDVLDAITEVGTRAGSPAAAADLVGGLRARLARVADAVAGRPRPRVLVLEWTDPPFLAGHWVPELVDRAGGAPVAGVAGGRSVTARWDELPGLCGPGVDAVLVAPCGYGLDDAVAQAEAVRDRLATLPGPAGAAGPALLAVDSGGLVVRAGPRLVDGIEALAAALHPGAVPAGPPGRLVRLPAAR